MKYFLSAEIDEGQPVLAIDATKEGEPPYKFRLVISDDVSFEWEELKSRVNRLYELQKKHFT